MVSKESTTSVVIPAYNEAVAIGEVIKAVRAIDSYEILVVDDGSTDGTAKVAEAHGVRVIRLRHNRGYGAALKAGIRAAKQDIIVTLDADGQHDPTDIPRLLETLAECDLATGARTRDSHTSWLRRPGKFVLGQAANYLAGMRLPDLNCGLRAFKRDVAMRYFHILPNGFSFSTTLLLAMLKGGYEVTFVPVVTHERIGKSEVKQVRDGMATLLLIIRTIALFDPLKVFLPVSLAQFLLALGYVLLTMIIYQVLNIPSGAILLFVSSILTFMFGILADQISALRRGNGS
jgi:glycosyltransferase involved in cell wall biosynthesis